MKKSVAFLFAVLISTTATFGFVPWLQTLFQDDVNTSEGSFFCSMVYYGKNKGQEVANDRNSWEHLAYTTKVSKGRWEAVNYVSNRYQHSAGDTYCFLLGFIPRGSIITVDAWHIVVEYTSNSQYQWWAFYDKTGEVYR
jgi:hypothetical protein